ncbi:hypothetical protein HU200_029793 [Digitaria exilis]|uniref:F-box domain-containing protein n=1 Tax=Digitaria exilis TaxID=1010633 RepID=A0A835BT60_9POAL|nr:hypothetical protein HU200_029793 [Digitaria exilis]
MEDLPDALLGEIIKRLTSTSDLNSFSLVSKNLYTVEAELRDAIRVGCGICPVTVALPSIGSRFSNLCKVEFNYSGWKSDHGMQLDNQGLHVLSSCCPSLTDMILSFCLFIDDSGLGFPSILQEAGVSQGVSTAEWLEYLGRVGSLEELVVKYCEKICQYDLLKFGPGWMKLQKFEFQLKGWHNIFDPRDPSYVPNYQYRYDFLCEHLKDLTLAKIVTQPEIGLRYLLRKCKALENLRLHYVLVLSDNDMITLIHSCSNLRSISLRFEPLFNERPEGRVFSTPLTDESLKALALRCPMLQTVELIFAACEPIFPSEIGFTQEGFLMLIKSCPIRDLILCGANFFNDEGMKALSSARYLDTLELMDCVAVTDVGMRLLAHAPRLTNLTLRQCDCFTDNGVGEVVRAHKLESLIVEGCSRVSGVLTFYRFSVVWLEISACLMERFGFCEDEIIENIPIALSVMLLKRYCHDG